MRRLPVLALTILLMAMVPAPAGARGALEAEGEFTATVDFSTLTLTPRGSRCLLEVQGEIVFEGALEGTASAETAALVFASCDHVATNPPGTFRDSFRADLDFTGTLNGHPAIADITYLGVTEVGGNVAGVMILSHGLTGVLKIDAIVAVGGSYHGRLIPN